MAKRVHPFKPILYANGANGHFFQLWQSEKFPRLQMAVIGNTHDSKVIRQFRIEDYDDGEDLTLARAIGICRDNLYSDYLVQIAPCGHDEFIRLSEKKYGAHKPRSDVHGNREHSGKTKHLRQTTRRSPHR